MVQEQVRAVQDGSFVLRFAADTLCGFGQVSLLLSIRSPSAMRRSHIPDG